MLEPLFHRLLAPGLIRFGSHAALPFDRFGVLNEPLGRVGPAIENDVFDQLLELRLDLFVNRELAGVDDAHVETGLDRVVQEHCVHCFAHDIVAAERKRNVRNAAGNVHAGARRFDFRGIDSMKLTA